MCVAASHFDAPDLHPLDDTIGHLVKSVFWEVGGREEEPFTEQQIIRFLKENRGREESFRPRSRLGGDYESDHHRNYHRVDPD